MEHPANVSNSTLQERIAAVLERDIVEGRISAGQRLLQNELASRFNVSHIPVREALRTLGARGLVDISPQRGARAAAFSAEEIRDVLEVRILLETAALKAAIPRLERSDYAALAQAIRDIAVEREPARWPALRASLAYHHERPAQVESRT
jgi:DNA-binding GntR family transcriptional regulator